MTLTYRTGPVLEPGPQVTDSAHATQFAVTPTFPLRGHYRQSQNPSRGTELAIERGWQRMPRPLCSVSLWEEGRFI